MFVKMLICTDSRITANPSIIIIRQQIYQSLHQFPKQCPSQQSQQQLHQTCSLPSLNISWNIKKSIIFIRIGYQNRSRTNLIHRRSISRQLINRLWRYFVKRHSENYSVRLIHFRYDRYAQHACLRKVKIRAGNVIPRIVGESQPAKRPVIMPVL